MASDAPLIGLNSAVYTGIKNLNLSRIRVFR